MITNRQAGPSRPRPALKASPHCPQARLRTRALIAPRAKTQLREPSTGPAARVRREIVPRTSHPTASGRAAPRPDEGRPRQHPRRARQPPAGGRLKGFQPLGRSRGSELGGRLLEARGGVGQRRHDQPPSQGSAPAPPAAVTRRPQTCRRASAPRSASRRHAGHCAHQPLSSSFRVHLVLALPTLHRIPAQETLAFRLARRRA